MKETGFMDKMQNVLVPIGTKLSGQRHIAAISKALMASVPLTMIGAVMQIIANPPVTKELVAAGGWVATIFGGWYRFAQANQAALMVPYNMTMGLFALVVSFTVAYELAKSYKMNGLMQGIVSMLMFLMVAAPATTFAIIGQDGKEAALTAMDVSMLGSAGMFSAIIIAVISVSLTQLCISRNWVVKLPDVVPPSLSDSFSALIPVMLNVLIIYGGNILCIKFANASLPYLIMGILMKPLKAVNSIPVIMLLTTLAALLWIVGIHGAMIVYPILMPLMIEAAQTNATLYAAGKPTIFFATSLFGSLAMVGGSGNTLGLSILASRSKSKQLSAVGKISIVPGIFGINEPMTFGMPIMFNPILAIPFVLSPLIISVFQIIGYKLGILRAGHIPIMTLMPIGIGTFLGSMHLPNMLFQFAMIPVMMLLYYPFFKAYEKQLLIKEAAAEGDNEQIVSESKVNPEVANM